MASPGWYDDPEHPGWLRRWNGVNWVDEWTPALGAPSSVSTTSSRRRRRRAVFVAPLLVGLLLLGGVVVWALNSGQADERSLSSGSSDPTGVTSPLGDPAGDDGASLLDECGRSEILTIPATDISIEPLSLEQERSIGAETRSLVLQQYQVSNDSDTQALLELLLDEVQPEDTEVDFNVTLLDSTEVNAFAIPGGDLFFTSAITSLMNEDELAFVMGHEIGHVVCRHLAQQFEREALVIAGLDALFGSDLDMARLYAEAAATVLKSIADLKFSREDELESDLVALELLAATGRPLGAGPSALRVLNNLEGNLEPSDFEVFFSTHPPTSRRIEQLETEIAQR